VASQIALSLSASSTELLSGGKPVALTATPSDATAAVAWQLAAGSPGTLSATSGTNVIYTPPTSAVSAITPVTITVSAGGTSRTLALTLYPDPGTPGLSLLAGSTGGQYYLDGTGTAARFTAIAAMTQDGSGNLLVADTILDPATGNVAMQAIRKVSAAGVVSTVIKTVPGETDGASGQATLGFIGSLSAASDGSVYFHDSGIVSGLTPVRRLAADGSVSTILSTPSAFDHVVATASGTVYVIEATSIAKLVNGVLTAFAGGAASGSAVDGQGTSASFIGLGDVSTDAAGNLYAIDGQSVRKITPNAVVSTLAGTAADIAGGSASDGSGSAAHFSQALSLAVNTAGEILVLDKQGLSGAQTEAIRKVSAAGVVSTIYSDSSNTTDTLLRISNGKIFVASPGEIRLLGPDGKLQAFAGLGAADSSGEVDGAGASARFVRPTMIAADNAGNVYVVDYVIDDSSGLQTSPDILTLRKITAAGSVSTVLSQEFGTATGMAVDQSGNIYLSRVGAGQVHFPSFGGAIYKLTPAGALTLLAGSTDTNTTIVDGSGAAARFVVPTIAGIDLDGNLYATDVSAGATYVRKITPGGVVSTVSSLPAGLQAAPDGNTYTVDAAKGVVYRNGSDGQVVVAGVSGQSATILGALPGGLSAPTAIAPTGPGSFAIIAGSAIIKLVLPH
jgi:hypothetical protein